LAEARFKEVYMRARQVMTRSVQTIAADTSVYDAAKVLLNAGVSAAPVVDADGKMLGIVSEADLMHRSEIGTVPGKSWLQRLLADDVANARDYIRAHSHRVADVMTKDVVTADEQASLGEVAALMQRHHIKRVPILREGRLVGIVSRTNLLQGLLAREPSLTDNSGSDDELRSIVMAVFAKHSWASSSLPTNVVVENGVVHLWGYVSSTAVKDAYRIAAENVPGVQRVENHMGFLPPETHFGV
jgi:CBS domain-containing protein